MHEAQTSVVSSFVTLTYADNPLSLVPRDLELFWKRLRKHAEFRYFACGEYGDVKGRPHYHALLFGMFFADRRRWRQSAAGFQLYRSELLERVWGHGHCEVGEVSFESAAYVARYGMKALRGKDREAKRSIIDVTTGEVVEREHEFARMSRRPGIGSEWYRRYAHGIYPIVMERDAGVINDVGISDDVVIDANGMAMRMDDVGICYNRGGAKLKAPKFYDRKFREECPAGYEALAAHRLRLADDRFNETHPDRMRAREAVEKARVGFLKRSL